MVVEEQLTLLIEMLEHRTDHTLVEILEVVAEAVVAAAVVSIALLSCVVDVVEEVVPVEEIVPVEAEDLTTLIEVVI